MSENNQERFRQRRARSNMERDLASITIRKLDSKTKQWLRIRAAKNGNSMEEEARLLFDELQSNESALNSRP